MRALLTLVLVAALLPAAGAIGAAEPEPPAAARVEARSSDFLAVGTVRGDRMVIHVSRVADNAPVHDATLAVVLRGTTYPASAEPDGSYTIRSADLGVPGTAAVVFDVAAGGRHEQLTGSLEIGGAHEQHDNFRQLLWWVLNSAVCVGFLIIWNRRRQRSGDAD